MKNAGTSISNDNHSENSEASMGEARTLSSTEFDGLEYGSPPVDE